MKTSSPSRETYGYYFSTVVPAIREYSGYLTDAEAHRAIKAAMFEMHPDDPKLPSMASMTQQEAGRLIDFAIVKAAEMGIIIPDAHKHRQVDKFNGMGVSMDDLPK